MTPAAVAKRLATLERQLQRYLARPVPVATSAARATRNATLRQRVIRDNLREQRALRDTGTAVSWRWVMLTPEDEQRVSSLMQSDIIEMPE